MGQHIGEFFKNKSKYRKIVGGLDKEKWYELDHFVAQLLIIYPYMYMDQSQLSVLTGTRK